jgi:AcrR family transcriptional regulator
LAQQKQGTSTQRQDASRRQERAHRILDAAAALILRWGYNKTTIDDIARQAGVAKGTIYLHWKTREELFAALMKREKLDLGKEIQRLIAADPAGATLRGMFKHSMLAMIKRPLMKAVFLRDMDILGKLAQSQQSDESHQERLAGFNAYLESLREHGLVRTDLSLRAQAYIISAISTGFLVVEPFLPDEDRLSDEERAELIAETVHRTLEPEHAPSAEALQIVSNAFQQYLDHSMSVAQEQFQQEIES